MSGAAGPDAHDTAATIGDRPTPGRAVGGRTAGEEGTDKSPRNSAKARSRTKLMTDCNSEAIASRSARACAARRASTDHTAWRRGRIRCRTVRRYCEEWSQVRFITVSGLSPGRVRRGWYRQLRAKRTPIRRTRRTQTRGEKGGMRKPADGGHRDASGGGARAAQSDRVRLWRSGLASSSHSPAYGDRTASPTEAAYCGPPPAQSGPPLRSKESSEPSACRVAKRGEGKEAAWKNAARCGLLACCKGSVARIRQEERPQMASAWATKGSWNGHMGPSGLPNLRRALGF